MMSFPFQFLVASETSSCYFGHCVALWVSQSAWFPQNVHQTVFLRRTAWISHSLICNLIPSSYCSYQLAINQSQNKPIRRCSILANSWGRGSNTMLRNFSVKVGYSPNPQRSFYRNCRVFWSKTDTLSPFECQNTSFSPFGWNFFESQFLRAES